ncbi:MAG TPA: hypothetical protein VMI06_02140 [Terriglobia bacterium]|nr:hypothetical protein [Terriglobia bacterium]
MSQPCGLRVARFLPLAVAGCAILAATATIRGQVVQRLKLKASETVPVPSVGWGPIIGEPKCDVAGNVYLRMYRAERMMAAPVIKVAQDGSSVTRFRLSEAPKFRSQGTFQDFAVGQEGEVYLLAEEPDNPEGQAVVVVFRSDGQYEDTVQLRPFSFAMHFAVFFSSGDEFLISGEVQKSQGEAATERPLTAVFYENGESVRYLDLPQASGAGNGVQAAPGGKKSAGRTELPPNGVALTERTLLMQRAVSGDDGNVYLLRPPGVEPGSASTIWVVSPYGQVVRILSVTPPEKGFRPMWLGEAGGQVACSLYRAQGQAISLETCCLYSAPRTGTGSSTMMCPPGSATS